MGAKHCHFCSGSMMLALWILVLLLSIVHALVNPRTVPTARTMMANPMMHGRRRRYSLPSSTIAGGTNVYDDTSVEILQGKLTILQDVVKELHGRRLQENDKLDEEEELRRRRRRRHQVDAAQQTKRLQAQLKSSETLLAIRGTELENLQSQLVELQKGHQGELEDFKQRWRASNINLEKQVDRLQEERDTDRARSQSQLEDQEHKIQALRAQIKRESRQYQETIQELEEELASMLKLQNDKELIEQRQSQDALQAKWKEEQAEKETQFEHVLQNAREQQKVLVEEYEHRLEAMTTQIETLSTTAEERNEQVEIAAAAVRAAERREAQLKVQTNKIQEQLKRTQLHAMLQQVVLDGVEQDREQAFEEARQLKAKLRRAQQHIESLEAEKSKGLWSRMRSRLSRKRKVPS